ncbi:metallophosphoesterase family protein [Flavobacterium sp. ANB]|uniref:metallophosphoesterase family protein n=1 Tax=unclassified Flavobacterium TaxID=196869 RepID=UPI0012B92754|nr:MULTISPECIES: metallophosphoesterase family protein [unclassified Flavobacterium]MBF4519390.1 metallophosphoesterase family protein [Flavobacterium sp. ANB]MTD72278.1 YfcE family phosphodiesterase [Flavobacterium sp. LC2016-13]
MRIAIISDIHANFPALEQTLKSIEQQNIDTVYCLGDLVGYNLCPNAVINEIRKRHIPTLAGNHDVKAVEIHNEGSNDSESYAYQIVGKEQIKYLSALPSHIKLEFQTADKLIKILMVHGSPYSNKEYLLEDKKEKDFTAIFLDSNADIIICGHSHKPYHRVLENPNKKGSYFHAINAGSVGKPKDGNPKSCYAVLTIDKSSNLSKKEGVQVEFIRVDYDIEKTAMAIEESPLPNVYALMLRKAY